MNSLPAMGEEKFHFKTLYICGGLFGCNMVICFGESGNLTLLVFCAIGLNFKEFNFTPSHYIHYSNASTILIFEFDLRTENRLNIPGLSLHHPSPGSHETNGCHNVFKVSITMKLKIQMILTVFSRLSSLLVIPSTAKITPKKKHTKNKKT